MKMADRRRRRRASLNSEECSEDETAETPQEKNVGVRKVSEKSEQEEEETETESEEEEDDEEEETDEEEEEDEDEEYDEEDDIIVEDGWIEEERQSGDGEEQPDSTKEKDLDDDEDRKNPAYIPRRGMFYEHDDRRMDEDDGGAPVPETVPEIEQNVSRPKKKLWKEELKWDHDRFNPDQQAPKSREELIAAYGYDIRAYDKPPDRPKQRNRGRPPRRTKQLSDYIQDRPGDYDKGYQYDGYQYDNRSRGEYQYNNNNRGRYGDRRGRGGSRGRGGRRNAPPRSYAELRGDVRNSNDSYSREDEPPHTKQFSNTSDRIIENRDDRERPNSSSPEKSYSPDKQEQNYRSVKNKPAQSAPPVRNIVDNNYDNTQSSNVSTAQPEKKSYSRERRTKGIGKTRYQENIVEAAEGLERVALTDQADKKAADVEVKTQVYHSTSAGDGPDVPTVNPEKDVNKVVPVSTKSEKKFHPVSTAPVTSGKAETVQSRPKRYSSQRQRALPDAPYQDQIIEGTPAGAPYYGQAYPAAGVFHPEQHVPQTFIQQPRLPQQVGFTLPVTSPTAIHSPPRIFNPAMTTLATTQQQLPGATTYFPPEAQQPGPHRPPLLQPPFITPPGLSFSAAGAPPHYQMGGHISVPGFTPAAPPPPQPPMQVAAQQPEIQVRGGTTYFPTEVQQPSRQRGGTTYFPPEIQQPSPQRGGTTYFPPEIQQPSPHRSPVRRQKAAIPIVNPQDFQRHQPMEREESFQRSAAEAGYYYYTTNQEGVQQQQPANEMQPNHSVQDESTDNQAVDLNEYENAAPSAHTQENTTHSDTAGYDQPDINQQNMRNVDADDVVDEDCTVEEAVGTPSVEKTNHSEQTDTSSVDQADASQEVNLQSVQQADTDHIDGSSKELKDSASEVDTPSEEQTLPDQVDRSSAKEADPGHTLVGNPEPGQPGNSDPHNGQPEDNSQTSDNETVSSNLREVPSS